MEHVKLTPAQEEALLMLARQPHGGIHSSGHGLVRRSLATGRIVYGAIGGHAARVKRYTLTPEGMALAETVRARREVEAQARLDADGVVTVPTWALRRLLPAAPAGRCEVGSYVHAVRVLHEVINGPLAEE